MSETKEPEVAKSLRVLDITREDERPREQHMASAVGVEGVENRLEVSADDFYERGFAIARAMRAWANHSGDGARPGLPTPSGVEQAAGRVLGLSDKDFDAGYEKGVTDVKGAAAVGRAKAIEAVRLLMTALIRQQAGGPVNLHIGADDEQKGRWRLFEPVPTLDL